jgi:hypothetical protein
MREQQPEQYKGIFLPIQDKLHDDEGSILAKAGIKVATVGAIGFAAVLVWSKLTGGVDFWSERSVTSKPAVVTDVFPLRETCFAGYTADTATTAKAQGYIEVNIPFSDKKISEPIPTAWRTQSVVGETQVKVCQEATEVEYTFDTGSGVMDIEVPYSALSFEADMPADTREILPDGGVFNELGENAINTLSIFSDNGPVADSQSLDNGLINIAEAQNIENTVTSCSDEVWDRFAKGQFIEGNTESITAAAEALEVEPPTEINVTFTGESLNPHSQYQDYLAQIEDVQELSIAEDSIGQCTVEEGVIEEG